MTEFVKLVKPFDESSTNPKKVEEWIEEIKKAYRAQWVKKKQKVPFVTFLLKKMANDWWKFEENLMKPLIIWKKFKESYYKEYFPNDVRQQMQ